jgi:hypothetical protein
MDSLKLKILSLKQKAASQRRPYRAGFCGLYGPLVDPVELHTQKMEDVYHQIRELQTSFRNKQSVCFNHACFAQMLVAWFYLGHAKPLQEGFTQSEEKWRKVPQNIYP